jgi:uncharacterized membrane protein YdfJ with MMPL/SSD domain
VSEVFVLVLFAATSSGLYLVGRLRLRLGSSLRAGLEKTLETIGLAALFLGANVAIAVASILGLQSMGFTVSMYVGADPAVIGLSLLQAVVFQFWRYGDRT